MKNKKREKKQRIFKKIDKRAAMTVQQIVILLVLIMSFAVILFLYIRLNLGGVTDEQVCHNSVVLRGKSLILSKTVPLDCKTQYVCFSANRECDAMVSPGEIISIKSDSPPKALKELNENIANLMADCWWMYGEGRIDYLGEINTKKDNYCSNCYQIAFDSSLYKEGGPLELTSQKLSEESLYSYLLYNDVPGKTISYYTYFTGVPLPEKSAGEFYSLGGIPFREFDLDGQYYITMAISNKDVPTWVKITAIVGAVGLTVLTGGTFGVIAAGVTMLGSASYLAGELTEKESFLGIAIEGESGNSFLTPTLVRVGSKEYSALNCADVQTLS